jgi:hypothetical protein
MNIEFEDDEAGFLIRFVINIFLELSKLAVVGTDTDDEESLVGI